jgi:hypothetical protein
MSSFLFITDLDHTFVGDDSALEILQQQLREHRRQHGTKIVYATGRSPTLYRQLQVEKALLEPDALISSVGTEIYCTDNYETPDLEWSEWLSSGWNREVIVTLAADFPALTPQPDSEQRPFKVSYFISPTDYEIVAPQLQAGLQAQNLTTRLIYSGSQDLDILPRRGNKGLAMQFLANRWQIEPHRTVACGDSGNDIDLFQVGAERGILVGNAKPELLAWYRANPSPHLYLAKAYYAAGILEGLIHFGFINNISNRF